METKEKKYKPHTSKAKGDNGGVSAADKKDIIEKLNKANIIKEKLEFDYNVIQTYIKMLENIRKNI